MIRYARASADQGECILKFIYEKQSDAIWQEMEHLRIVIGKVLTARFHTELLYFTFTSHVIQTEEGLREYLPEGIQLLDEVGLRNSLHLSMS